MKILTIIGGIVAGTAFLAAMGLLVLTIASEETAKAANDVFTRGPAEERESRHEEGDPRSGKNKKYLIHIVKRIKGFVKRRKIFRA